MVSDLLQAGLVTHASRSLPRHVKAAPRPVRGARTPSQRWLTYGCLLPAVIGLVLLVFAEGVVLGGSTAQVQAGGGSSPSPAPRTGAAAGEPGGEACDWADVLARLDRQRAAAWRAGDPERLAQVFAPGTPVLQRDRARLAEYVARGFRVVGVRTSYTTCRVVARTSTKVTLDVVDQLTPALVVGAGQTRRWLPFDQPSSHRITLESARPGGWRISAIQLP